MSAKKEHFDVPPVPASLRLYIATATGIRIPADVPRDYPFLNARTKHL
jgi:hypothetical protein